MRKGAVKILSRAAIKIIKQAQESNPPVNNRERRPPYMPPSIKPIEYSNVSAVVTF